MRGETLDQKRGGCSEDDGDAQKGKKGREKVWEQYICKGPWQNGMSSVLPALKRSTNPSLKFDVTADFAGEKPTTATEAEFDTRQPFDNKIESGCNYTSDDASDAQDKVNLHQKFALAAISAPCAAALGLQHIGSSLLVEEVVDDIITAVLCLAVVARGEQASTRENCMRGLPLVLIDKRLYGRCPGLCFRGALDCSVIALPQPGYAPV